MISWAHLSLLIIEVVLRESTVTLSPSLLINRYSFSFDLLLCFLVTGEG